MKNRISKALLQEISKYNENKAKNNPNRSKVTFFKEIITLIKNNQLTVEVLTDKLISLGENDRKEIFRRGGLYRRVSTASTAAKLINQLYLELGVNLTGEILQAIVTGALNKQHDLINKIKHVPIIKYLNQPYIPGIRQHLEHELKNKLKLADISMDISLTAAILSSLTQVTDKDEFKKQIINYYLKIYEFSPELFTEILVDLKQALQNKEKNSNSQQYELFLDSIYELIESKNDNYNKIKKALYSADHDIAKMIVMKNPKCLFELSLPLQSSVHIDLLNEGPKAQHTIKSINQYLNKQPTTEAEKNAATRIKVHKIHVAEAQYQQYLIRKALNNAQKLDISQLRFDPQGHLITEVTLDDSDYTFLVEQLSGEKIKEKLTPKQQLEMLLGLKNGHLSTTTFCNLDVFGHPELEKKFKQWARTQRTNKLVNQDILDAAINIIMKTDSRGSINALQEEMEMHMRISARVLEKYLKDKIQPQKLHAIQLKAALEINKVVRIYFQRALIRSYEDMQNNQDNFIAVLNQELDKARKEIASVCKKQLIAACLNEEFGLGKEEFFKIFTTDLVAKINKHDFESTTAITNDYLRTDNRNETVTRISGTNETAHNKRFGANNQAFRTLHRNHYVISKNQQLIVKPRNNSSIEARVPSLAVPILKHTAAVYDVAGKLEVDYENLQGFSADNIPMTYHLLTSLTNKIGDKLLDSKNQQRLSAARILKGSHKFNQWQINKGKVNSLCYVINIPVNQHTNGNMNYNNFDDAIAEAALMSDLALLSIFNQQSHLFGPLQRNMIQKMYSRIHSCYVEFLDSTDLGDKYFFKTKQGKNAIQYLRDFKFFAQQSYLHLQLSSEPTINELVTKALFKMFYNDHHWHKQYGMLIQAFSVLVSKISLAGCKSANERYQAVAGRVEMLESIGLKKSTSTYEKNLLNALVNYIQSEEKNPIKLQEMLDKSYNEHNLQGSAASFSEVDQGGPSKVQASKNNINSGELKFTEINTNIAETGYITYLSQKYAASLQAHKGNHANALKEVINTQREQYNKNKENNIDTTLEFKI